MLNNFNIPTWKTNQPACFFGYLLAKCLLLKPCLVSLVVQRRERLLYPEFCGSSLCPRVLLGAELRGGRNQHHMFGFVGRGPLCTIMVRWYNNLAGPKRYIRALGCASWWGNEHWMTIFPSNWQAHDMSCIHASEFLQFFMFFNFRNMTRKYPTHSAGEMTNQPLYLLFSRLFWGEFFDVAGMAWRREEFHGSFLKIASVTSRETKMVVFHPGPEGVTSG